MEPAEVKSISRQSTAVSRAKSFGAAALALGPRFPRAAAVPPWTESSGISRREILSVTLLSSTESGLTRCANSARRSAALARATGDLSARTFAITSSRFALSTGSVEACITLAITDSSATTGSIEADTYILAFKVPHFPSWRRPCSVDRCCCITRWKIRVNCSCWQNTCNRFGTRRPE